MKRLRLAAATLLMAVPVGAIVVTPGALAKPRPGHHRHHHARHHAKAHTVSFYARVLRASAHGLVVRYVLDALEGRDPAPRVDGVPWAEPFALERPDLERAVARLDSWVQNPRW